jgi:uncharacterized protein (TIGR03118 family)
MIPALHRTRRSLKLRRSQHAIPCRLAVEALEDRCVLSQTIFPFFQQVNLFADQAGVAQHQDSNLVNGWGIAVGPRSTWVSSNGADSSVVYRGGANGQPWVNTGLVVSIPGGAPTGQVFNPTSDFVVSDGNGHSGPAAFIFASENGTVTGWNPGVPPPFSHDAQIGATIPDGVLKGIALGSNPFGNFLYVTDFRHGKVDVFDSHFNLVPITKLVPNAFHDDSIPKGYAPFGIQNIGGKLFVTYALQDAAKHDDVRGTGHGFIDVYDTEGHLLQKFAQHVGLNSPWGVALAPSDFGFFSNDILVSNFGSGRISAYDATTGKFQGFLLDTNQQILTIDGLWGIAFGNGTTSGETNQLLFSAGPNDEGNGLFGFLQVSSQGITIPDGHAATGHGGDSSILGHALLADIIRDGRSGLLNAANRFGESVAKSAGDSTSGHSISSSTSLHGMDAPAAISGAHGHSSAMAQAIDSVFATIKHGAVFWSR